MPKLIKLANRWFASILLSLSALCLMALMLLTVAEVIGRYAFNAPIFGRQDISQYLLACSIFFAFPVMTLRGEQIVVDLLDGIFNKSIARIRDILIELVMATTFLTMCFWLLHRAEKAQIRGLTSELLLLPKYPLMYFIAITIGLTGTLLGFRVVWKLFNGSTKDTS